MFVFFFFQAEDGIRDDLVTGVQTCALPISMIGTNCEDHQLRIDQVVPIIVGTREMPAAQDSVDVRLKVEDRKLSSPYSLISLHDRAVLEIVVVAPATIPTLRGYPLTDSLRASRKHR